MTGSEPRSAEASAREVWSSVAKGWDAGYEWYARNIQPLTDWFCRTVASPGARVLDLASGTGQPALAIARRVRPGGRIVATDISPEMLRILERRARESGLDNIDVLEMDAHALRFAAHTFDAVSCACGLMFCPDPDRAAREIRRVLLPGGRFAIAVWDEPSRNPFFAVAGRALAEVLPAAPADPTAPGPFRLGAPGALEQVLRGADFTDLVIERHPMVFELESIDEYWRTFTGFAAGVSQKVAVLSDHERGRAQDALRRGAQEFLSKGRIDLTATALCVSGRAP